MKRSCFAKLLATGGLLVFLVFPAFAQNTDSSSKLLVVDSRGGVWSSDLTGTNAVKLPIDGTVIHAQPSPAMDKLLYVTEDRQTDPNDSATVYLYNKLFVSDMAGGNPQLVSDKIANVNVFFMTDITDPQPLPMFLECGGPRLAHWNPDGRRILYTAKRATNGSFAVMIADVVDKTEKELVQIPATTRVEVDPMKGLFSNIPASVLAERYVQNRPFIKLYNAAPELDLEITTGGRMRPGQAMPKPKVNAWFGATFSFHPDGKSVTWSSSGNTNYQGIFVKDLSQFNPADTKSLESSSRVIWGDQFLWAPNGEHVAIQLAYGGGAAGTGHQVLLANRTNILRVLFHEPPFRDPGYRPVSIRAWSADSSRLAIDISTPSSKSSVVRIIDLNAPTNIPPIDVPHPRVGRPIPAEMKRHKYAFTPDGGMFCFVEKTINPQGRTTSSYVSALPLPPSGQRQTGAVNVLKFTPIPFGSFIEEIHFMKPKEELCPPLELVIPAGGRDAIFAETSEDPALAIADPQKRAKELAEIRKRRDVSLTAWARLPALVEDHKKRTQELREWLKKTDPGASTWTPWLPTEWDKQRKFLEKHLRSVEADYARTVSAVFGSVTASEEQRLVASLKERIECLGDRTAKALDDVRSATVANAWKDYFLKKSAYDWRYNDLVHTLTVAQAIHSMRLANAQGALGDARTQLARSGTLAAANGNAALRAQQKRLRDIYLDIGDAALRLNAAQTEAGLLAQESYFASFWGVYKTAGNTEWAETMRSQAFQMMIFGMRATVAGGQSAMGALVDSAKRVVNWLPETVGYSPLDPVAKDITKQIGESREATELSLATLNRVRGLSDEIVRGLYDRGKADAGVSQLSTNRVFLEQTAGGWRRLSMCYESDPSKLMEHEFMVAHQHVLLTAEDMEKVFNARVLADAKGQFGTLQKFKRLLTDPLGTAKVFIQNSDFGGDHFSAPLEHIARRKAEAQEMLAMLPWLQRAGFDPVQMAMANPKMFATYLDLAKSNPDFLQWTLTRRRLDAQKNVDALELALALAPPENQPDLQRKITFNRTLVALETADQQSWLLQLQGLDKMMMWDYDAALEFFYQASECNSNALPRANVERLRADLNWQRTIETGMESFQQTGNLAVQAALFEFVGGQIGKGLGMKAGAKEAAAALEEEFFLLRPMYGSKFLDFAWKQFNPFSEFVNAFYQQASLAKVGQQSLAQVVSVGTQVIQADVVKTALLKGWCGMDDQWADFLANALVSVAQVKPGDKHTLFWELCVRLQSAANDIRWELINLGLINGRDQARRSVADFYFFHEMLLEAKQARDKLKPKKLATAPEAEAKAAAKPLADAEAKLETKTKPLNPETLQQRFEKFFGKDAPKPGTPERIARIAEFFQGLRWSDLMALKLAKDHPLNRLVDNLRREIVAVAQVEFFNDPRFAKYKQHLVAYLYIGSAGRKTSAAYKLIDSDVDFTMLVNEDTPESVRNQLRDDFMAYFQERAKGMALEDFEMSLMVDPMPKFDPGAETTHGIAEILWIESDPVKRAAVRAKLRANLEKTIEQLIRNASDKERYLDRGNLFRHNLFVRLGCFLKRAVSRVADDGVELEDLPPSEYDKLYADVPLEPWMAFDAIVGNLGYIFQHMPAKIKDAGSYHKVLSGKYALRGVLFSLLLMSPEGRERLGKISRAEVEAKGWEGAERICIEVAKELLARPDGMKQLGLPNTLEAPGHDKPIPMTAADWVRLFEEWGNQKEGLPIQEVFGKPRNLALNKNDRVLNSLMAENIVKTEAAFRAALRRSIMEQGTMLKKLQAAERTAKASGDAEAVELLRLKMKEILISQAAIWNRMSKEQQLIVLKEMPPDADWWAAIAEVESLNETAGQPAPTPLNPKRTVVSRQALLDWRPRVFMDENMDIVARRIALLKEKSELERKAAEQEKKMLLASVIQAAP